MYNFEVGNLVTRKSYNKDILFQIYEIQDDVYYLKGITARIFADAYRSDLILENYPQRYFEKMEIRGENIRSSFKDSRYTQKVLKYGKILHIDGDERYAKKTLDYYQKNGLPCKVYSIVEALQPKYIRSLLIKEKPDILIVTGHDSLAKNRSPKNIENYKNSKYYQDSVLEARKLESNRSKLAVFAGACQSYYEELISAGANFASSPGRVLIDFFDPLVVAQVLAITNNKSLVGMGNIVDKIKDGYKGVNGVPTLGKAEFVVKM